MWRVALTIASLVWITAAPITSLEARTWRIRADGTGDVPTIQAGVLAAGEGDTLLLAAGQYSWTNQGTGNDYGLIQILRGASPMTIISESGPETTIIDGGWRGRILFFQGDVPLTIEGITFTNGVAPPFGNFVGGAITAHLSSPVIRNCVFLNNTADQGGALWYGGVGAPQLINCRFEENSAVYGGAIFMINSSLTALISNCIIRNNSASISGGGLYCLRVGFRIENCLIADNTAADNGGGIYCRSNWPAVVTRCTIARNGAASGGGIACIGSAVLDVENSIVAFGIEGGAAAIDETSVLSFRCADLFGNAGGDWVGGLAGQNGIDGNFSGDPEFCGVASSDNFELQGDSPCAPGNHPDGNPGCDTIGMFEIGCGAVAAEHRTWGAIKAMFGD